MALIGIIDDKLGNLAFPDNTLHVLSAQTRLCPDQDALRKCAELILPGVRS